MDSLKAFVSDNYQSWSPVQLGIQVFGILAAIQTMDRPEQTQRAATLFGAQDEIHHCLLNVIPQAEHAVYQQAVASVQASASAEAFAAGRAMTTSQAIQYALTDLPHPE